MRYVQLGVFTLAVVFALAAPSTAATPAEIQAAIQKAVTFLESAQAGGNWDGPEPKDSAMLLASNGHTAVGSSANWGGSTALATYALLAAGQKPSDDAKLAAAITWLMDAHLNGTYAVALRASLAAHQVFSPAQYRATPTPLFCSTASFNADPMPAFTDTAMAPAVKK